MRYSISTRIFFPYPCPRVIRVKLASIAWAAVLLALGLDPIPVVADDRHPAAHIVVTVAGAKDRAHGKAGPDLDALHREYQTYLQRPDARTRGPSGFTSHNPLARIAEGYVVVDTAAEADPKGLAADLKALGLQGMAVFGRMVSGRLPIPAIPALENLPSLRFARPAYAMTLVGSVTSQGDTAMRADIARGAFAVNGTGVTVGVLSDSFNCLGGAAAGVATGDLPAGIVVLEEISNCTGATDEARALAEIVHDVAPGAAIAVHTAANGQANFAQGIVDLANAGARVITDDVLYFAEPMFQDGIVAQAVDQVKALGISYFSAAGNEGRMSYESDESGFRPSGDSFDIGFGPEEAHDFDPDTEVVDTCQRITVPARQSVIVDFQWDQPFASATIGGPGSQSDLDIVLTDAACNNLRFSDPNPFPGATNNVGRDPVEVFAFENPGSTAAAFGLRILRRTRPDPGLMKTVLFAGPGFTIDEFDTRSGASFGHSAALGGLGVGAADYRDTPAFGQNPPLIEPFSSAGGTPILFDTAGNRLVAAEVRAQPAITAPDGADTTFFGGSDPDGTGFPNFFGTSASAPHAAGIGALITERNPSFGPDNLYSVLRSTAIDMDDPATAGFDAGFDFGTGFGLIQADAALDLVPPLVVPPLVEVRPVGLPTTFCRGVGCRVQLNCQLPTSTGTVCRNQVGIFVRAGILRRGPDSAVPATRQRLRRFASATATLQPGETANVRLRLSPRGRRIVRQRNPRRFRATLRITSMNGASVTNTPIRIRIR
jgi:hypothetical protein